MALQNPLRGFAHFIGLFRGGGQPLDLNPTLQPVMEMEDWLGPNKWSLIDTASVASEGFVEITVPDSKFWRLKFVSIWVDENVPATTTNANIFLVKTINATSISIPLIPQMGYNSTFVPFGNQKADGFGFVIDKVNAEAGDKIRFQLRNSSATVDFHVRGFVQYQEIDV